ncbi:hypothetical protein DIZ27_05290 [Streptomyces sp. NWU339]|uniref:hypothetical protein n=1 Tax=Streptomyces sp. NWU339 TaxID=2185284 RepID=UPI000D679A85|nr:hypothetical protein [Streptomyces sp. NWU339]PWI11457.1 hypothetical protein DIZ27_05290 [Streptomyces sp. NWU339]
MTIEEQTPHVACLPIKGMRRRPEPVERADPAASPHLPSHGSHDELLSIGNTVARLSTARPSVDAVTARPSVDAVTVEATVRAAYDSFRQARVGVRVPIPVERRSRRVLRAADRTASGRAIDGRAASETRRAHPGPAKD